MTAQLGWLDHISALSLFVLHLEKYATPCLPYGPCHCPSGRKIYISASNKLVVNRVHQIREKRVMPVDKKCCRAALTSIVPNMALDKLLNDLNPANVNTNQLITIYHLFRFISNFFEIENRSVQLVGTLRFMLREAGSMLSQICSDFLDDLKIVDRNSKSSTFSGTLKEILQNVASFRWRKHSEELKRSKTGNFFVLRTKIRTFKANKNTFIKGEMKQKGADAETRRNKHREDVRREKSRWTPELSE